MKVTIDISEITAFDLFESTFKIERNTNLFKDLRSIFAKKVKIAMISSGLSKVEVTEKISAKVNSNGVQLNPIPSLYTRDFLDIDFCSGYGVSYYSLEAINYQKRAYTNLPSLDTFFKCENFSLGNFGFWIDNGDYEIEIKTNDSIKFVGYTSLIHPKKRKSFIAFIGIHFSEKEMNKIYERYYSIPDKDDLIDIKLSTVGYPAIFMCRRTGRFYVCNCFKGYIDWQMDFKRFARLDCESDIKERINNIEYKDGICHLCTKKQPNVKTEVSEYSNFLKKYSPYYHLENRKQFGSIFHFNKEDNIKVENDLRLYFSYPKIGEKWTSETCLFNIIKEIFPQHKPIFHYRGNEMEGLELDIFISELQIGIEYQGQQHYMPIKHWGGEEGLKQRQSSDKKKIELCKINNYTLIEFTYKDNLSKDMVIQRIEKCLNRNSAST